jgi:flagellar biosynthesis regulator FlbT
MNFFGIFLKAFKLKITRKLLILTQKQGKSYIYFFYQVLLCNKVGKHQESHQKSVEIYLELLKEILVCRRCKQHAVWCT